jgi:hypothetical protein
MATPVTSPVPFFKRWTRENDDTGLQDGPQALGEISEIH